MVWSCSLLLMVLLHLLVILSFCHSIQEVNAARPFHLLFEIIPQTFDELAFHGIAGNFWGILMQSQELLLVVIDFQIMLVLLELFEVVKLHLLLHVEVRREISFLCL